MIHQFGFIEKMLLGKDVIPHPLLDAGALVGAARALTASVRLGIVDALSGTPTPSAEVAAETGLSERGVVAVLDCLDALGYVAHDKRGYRLTRRGSRFLSAGSPHHFRSMLRFSHWAFNAFVDLEDTIKTGTPATNNLDTFTDEQWDDFGRAMIELARTNVDEVVKRIPVASGARRVLDLGGCHGLYCAALCKRHPELRAEVMDFPDVEPIFDEMMGAEGTADRVTFRRGNFTEDELGDGYDLVLGFNIVHGFDHDANRALTQRIQRALAPGGAYVVLDQISDAGGASSLAKLTTSFMALNLLHQAGGFTYSTADIQGWASAAGFSGARLHKLRAPGFGVVVVQ